MKFYVKQGKGKRAQNIIKKMLSCSIFPNIIDREIFKKWLEGYSSELRIWMIKFVVDEVVDYMESKENKNEIFTKEEYENIKKDKFMDQYVIEEYAKIKSAEKYFCNYNLSQIQLSHLFKTDKEYKELINEFWKCYYFKKIIDILIWIWNY